jgi:hypothetical protein
LPTLLENLASPYPTASTRFAVVNSLKLTLGVRKQSGVQLALKARPALESRFGSNPFDDYKTQEQCRTPSS